MSPAPQTYPRPAKCDCGATYTARSHHEYVYGCPECRELNHQALALMDPTLMDQPSPEHVYAWGAGAK